MSYPELVDRDVFFVELSEYLTGLTEDEVARAIDLYALVNDLAYDPRESVLVNEARHEMVLSLCEWAQEGLSEGLLVAGLKDSTYVSTEIEPVYGEFSAEVPEIFERK